VIFLFYLIPFRIEAKIFFTFNMFKGVEVIPGGLAPENGGVPKTSLINVFNRNVHGVGKVSLQFIAGHYASMLICLGEIQRIVYGDVMLT